MHSSAQPPAPRRRRHNRLAAAAALLPTAEAGIASTGQAAAAPERNPEPVEVSQPSAAEILKADDETTATSVTAADPGRTLTTEMPPGPVRVRRGDQAVIPQWKGDLPAPEPDRGTAGYREAVPGADVIVEATRTGFEQFARIHDRPSGPYSYTLPVKAKGLTAKANKGGSVTFTDAKTGQRKATMPAPVMGDAAVGKRSGEHVNRVRVGREVVNKGTGCIDLVVTPSAKFPADPVTQYPVTVDPSASALPTTFGTHLQPDETGGWSTDTGLGFGDPGMKNADGTHYNLGRSPWRTFVVETAAAGVPTTLQSGDSYTVNGPEPIADPARAEEVLSRDGSLEALGVKPRTGPSAAEPVATTAVQERAYALPNQRFLRGRKPENNAPDPHEYITDVGDCPEADGSNNTAGWIKSRFSSCQESPAVTAAVRCGLWPPGCCLQGVFMSRNTLIGRGHLGGLDGSTLNRVAEGETT